MHRQISYITDVSDKEDKTLDAVELVALKGECSKQQHQHSH